MTKPPIQFQKHSRVSGSQIYTGDGSARSFNVDLTAFEQEPDNNFVPSYVVETQGFSIGSRLQAWNSSHLQVNFETAPALGQQFIIHWSYDRLVVLPTP